MFHVLTSREGLALLRAFGIDRGNVPAVLIDVDRVLRNNTIFNLEQWHHALYLCTSVSTPARP
jgi:hypothetical protein